MPRFAESRLFRSLVIGAIAVFLFPAGAWAATIVVGGTGAALGTIQVLADAYLRDNPGIEIEVPASLGSGGGIRGASTGVLGIGLSSRPLNDGERKANVSASAYARSPFIFATSNAMAEPRLTRKELVTIYGGGRVFWSDGSRVRPILRPESDGDNELLIQSIEEMAAAIAKARAIPGIPVAVTDQDAMSKAEKIQGGLTTATLTAVLAEGRNLIPVSLDGVAPSIENLASGAYPLSKTFYIVTGPGTGEAARGFIDFIRSPAGAAILTRTGNIVVPDAG